MRQIPENIWSVYGRSHKTTVYFPDDLKIALEREAARRGCSEAQVIRDAVSKLVSCSRASRCRDATMSYSAVSAIDDLDTSALLSLLNRADILSESFN